MILHFIPGQSHNGAAHRKNIDTPPLRGSCLGQPMFPVGNVLLLKGLQGRCFRAESMSFRPETAGLDTI